MAQYTIEDIEIIRQKSTLSYEEAVNLLEYHNGSLARALVDLEKNGKLKDHRTGTGSAQSRPKNLFTNLYRMRVKVIKGDITIVNLSALFVIFTAIVAFWVPLTGIIIAMILGYRISWERNSSEFNADSFESFVRNASSNVKQSVTSMARDLEDAANKTQTREEAPQKPEPHTAQAASGTTPVNVQFSEGGSVNVEDDGNGFFEANVE